MNYIYTPAPYAGTVPPPATGPYFMVGNECCGGCMSNDIDATTRVTLDYTAQLPSGVNVLTLNYSVLPATLPALVLSGNSLISNVATLLVSGGIVGTQYAIEVVATLSDGQKWVDGITVTITDCNGPQAMLPSPAVLGGMIYMQGMTITTLNILPALAYPTDGNIMILFVNGQAFFPIGAQPSFTISGKSITWTSTVYSLTPGAAVVALYTHT